MKFSKIIVLTFLSLFLMSASCDLNNSDVKNFKNSSDGVVQQQTEQLMSEANRQVGMPNITNFQEKKFLKQLYELRDQEDFICYAYLGNALEGSVGQYLGRCVGYGIPYSMQFSNPYKLGMVDGGEMNALNPYTITQPEPNGLFIPEGLNATFLMMLDENNEVRPVYVEQEIIVSPFKLH